MEIGGYRETAVGLRLVGDYQAARRYEQIACIYEEIRGRGSNI